MIPPVYTDLKEKMCVFTFRFLTKGISEQIQNV